MALAAIAAEAHSLSRKIAATRTAGGGKRAAIESVRRDCEAAMDKIGIQNTKKKAKMIQESKKLRTKMIRVPKKQKSF